MTVDHTEPQNSSYEGKVALVTGGSAGIGAATARILAQRGCTVAVNYFRSEVRAKVLVDALIDAGGKAAAFGADVTDEAQVESMVRQVESELGPIDVLVANAPGVRGEDPKLAPLIKLSWSDIEGVTVAQLKSFFLPARAVLPGMLSRGSGSIVAVGAAGSRRPVPGFTTVSVAKAGIEIGVKILAREVGSKGIRVNGVGPGLIMTDIGQLVPEPARVANAQRSALGRNGMPEDVANTIVFLASDEASYLTGSYLVIDGGTAML